MRMIRVEYLLAMSSILNAQVVIQQDRQYLPVDPAMVTPKVLMLRLNLMISQEGHTVRTIA